VIGLFKQALFIKNSYKRGNFVKSSLRL